MFRYYPGVGRFLIEKRAHRRRHKLKNKVRCNILDAAIRKLARAVFGQRDDAIAAAARLGYQAERWNAWNAWTARNPR
jgi:hypothetical protein